MIEAVSFPWPLASWNTREPPFYLEFYGETSPVVDRTFAEVYPAAGSDPAAPASAAAATGAPIYQYWWTIGHSAERGEFERIWSQLQAEVAARVYVFFPLSGGWRIKELVATVNYLHPFRQHTSWRQLFADDWKTLVAPTVAEAGSLAGLVPNPAFAGASALLGTIAKLQVNSVPQVADFAWSVGKITATQAPYGVLQGIMWTLPKRMFTDLGSRLTGSIALSFIPSHVQQVGVVEQGVPPLQSLPVLAHAVVYQPNGMTEDIWVPGLQRFVELQIEPRYGPDAGDGRGATVARRMKGISST